MHVQWKLAPLSLMAQYHLQSCWQWFNGYRWSCERRSRRS